MNAMHSPARFCDRRIACASDITGADLQLIESFDGLDADDFLETFERGQDDGWLAELEADCDPEFDPDDAFP